MRLSKRALDLLAKSGDLCRIDYAEAQRLIIDGDEHDDHELHTHVYQCDGEWYALRHQHGPAVHCPPSTVKVKN